jgi:hypothetical protein
MAGKNLLRKALPSLDSKTGCACLSPGEWTQTGDTGTRERSRHPPQRRNARARNGVAPQSAGSFRRHGESGATGTVAASAAVDLDLRHSDRQARNRFAGSAEPGRSRCQRSVARRLASFAGQEPKGSSVVMPFLTFQAFDGGQQLRIGR